MIKLKPLFKTLVHCKSNIQKWKKSVCLISNKSQNFLNRSFEIIKINDGRKKYSIDEIKSNYYQNVYLPYIFAL